MALPDSKHAGPVLSGPEYRSRYDGGVRTEDIAYIVLHDTESGPNTAKAVANYGRVGDPDNKVSWHFVVDDNFLIRCVPDDVVAWTAPPKNSDGLHIEIVGRASWLKLLWFVHQATLKRAAWQVARWCVKHNIPAKYVTDRDLKFGVPGIITHAQVSRVFKESTHTDPGTGFPLGYFLYLVKRRVQWLMEADG